MNIIYTEKQIKTSDLFNFYKYIGWNDFLNLSLEHLVKGMQGSWYVVYAYDNNKLVGTGRVVSEGD